MGWGREVEPIMSNSCIRPWSHRFLPDCILVNHFCLLLHDGLIGMSFAGFWQWWRVFGRHSGNGPAQCCCWTGTKPTSQSSSVIGKVDSLFSCFDSFALISCWVLYGWLSCSRRLLSIHYAHHLAAWTAVLWAASELVSFNLQLLEILCHLASWTHRRYWGIILTSFWVALSPKIFLVPLLSPRLSSHTCRCCGAINTEVCRVDLSPFLVKNFGHFCFWSFNSIICPAEISCSCSYRW